MAATGLSPGCGALAFKLHPPRRRELAGPGVRRSLPQAAQG
ncbi:MAG: hypothetical protein AVDCRST_MAG27-3174 [uncultured Craurococcus sp.]|uniref:Uncharacterized protein n=1 Tax=uncultured Craurococcus sp. TaxID=1135998 RepID=A0A6J4J6X8_9PROT|nr:MAG: hypothetical protein AVDCRST_MAG27-3174 [uncultured Craurococcus sp.]